MASDMRKSRARRVRALWPLLLVGAAAAAWMAWRYGENADPECAFWDRRIAIEERIRTSYLESVARTGDPSTRTYRMLVRTRNHEADSVIADLELQKYLWGC